MLCEFCGAEMPGDTNVCFLCKTDKNDVDHMSKKRICKFSNSQTMASESSKLAYSFHANIQTEVI